MEFVELNMKKKYSTLPESMKNMEMYGFNWMEFVSSVPSPLYIMTLRSTAHLIIEFPKEGGFENASNL